MTFPQRDLEGPSRGLYDGGTFHVEALFPVPGPLRFLGVLSCAASADTVASLDGSVLLETLPMDDYTVHGQAPDPAAMTDSGYSDPSIQVEIHQEWIDGSHYNIAHIKIAHASQLRTALERNSLNKNNYVWNIAATNNAVVATGGEFLNLNTGTYTIRMSQTLRTRGKKGRDALFIDQYGNFHITKRFTKDTVTELEAQGLQIVNAFNFGPALVIDGEAVYEQCRGKNGYPLGAVNYPRPRTAFGQLGPLEYLMVVVDGKNVKVTNADGTVQRSPGVDIFALGEFMYKSGCTQAYALDGGASAVMYFAKTGRYSTPNSRRAVTDIIYFASLAVSTQTQESPAAQ